MKEQAAGDIRAVGVAYRDQIAGVESVLFSSLIQKLLKLMGAEDQILFIEDAFRQAPEITGHAILQHISPDTQYRSAWGQQPGQGQQIMFVAPSTMEQY
ncbi:hypothetical protein D3C74_407520 [compost metagenome]